MTRDEFKERLTQALSAYAAAHHRDELDAPTIARAVDLFLEMHPMRTEDKS